MPTSSKNADDYDGLRLNAISILGTDLKLSKEEFDKIPQDQLDSNVVSSTLDHYKLKDKMIAERAFPIFMDIQKNKGATVTEVLVPFTDGKKQIGVATNLQKNIETECRELILSLEKISALAIIDSAWKDHLREMDDLKQSVQNAVYEQKDPLLIYKFEAFQMFKKLISKINEDTIAFLTKAELPVQQPEQVQEARRQRRKEHYNESKEESRSLLQGGQADTRQRPPVEKTLPSSTNNVAGRNDRVTVQYVDGTVKKDVKYKTVENDVLNNRCVIIDD